MRQSKRSRGITHVELVLGLSVLALAWFGGRWVLEARGSAPPEQAALSTAKQLARAAADWKRERPDVGCPTLSQLKLDRLLERDVRGDDPWGGRFRISCPGDAVEIRSAGGDGRFQTDDDIELSVPLT